MKRFYEKYTAFGICAILQQADDFDNMENMRRQEILVNTYKHNIFV